LVFAVNHAVVRNGQTCHGEKSGEPVSDVNDIITLPSRRYLSWPAGDARRAQLSFDAGKVRPSKIARLHHEYWLEKKAAWSSEFLRSTPDGSLYQWLYGTASRLFDAFGFAEAKNVYTWRKE